MWTTRSQKHTHGKWHLLSQADTGLGVGQWVTGRYPTTCHLLGAVSHLKLCQIPEHGFILGEGFPLFSLLQTLLPG